MEPCESRHEIRSPWQPGTIRVPASTRTRPGEASARAAARAVAGASDPWGKVLRFDLCVDIDPKFVPKILKNTHNLILQPYATQCTSFVQLVVICAATVLTNSGTHQESERQEKFQKLMKCMFLGDGCIISQVRKNIQRDIQSGLEFAKAGDDFLVIPENQQINVVLLLKELVKMEPIEFGSKPKP